MLLTPLKRVKIVNKHKLPWQIGLSDEQKAVVQDTEGVRLVAACPGGGKTKTLIQSIIYLLDELQVPYSSILAFTFTNQAADEMKERLVTALGPNSSSVKCTTMHAFFYQVFREQCHLWPGWNSRDVKLITQALGGNVKINRQILKEMNLPIEDTDTAQIRSRIGYWKNWMLSPDEAIAEYPDESTTAAFYRRYEELKDEQYLIDFEDMLFKTLEIFERFPDVAVEYADKYAYIFVDEYHDTSPVQNELIKKLNQRHGNLFLVCDPNQSIYGFRGANPDIVLEYQQHFPGAHLHRLTRNYRSRTNVVDACYQLINNNTDSQTLGLTAYSKKDGGSVKLLGLFQNEDEEAVAVMNHIAARVKTKEARWQDHFILYRMNAQSRALEEALATAQVPYRIVGSSSFFQRKEVKDVLAYLEFLNAPEPLGSAFERIYNRPNRFLGKAWYSQFLSAATTSRDLSMLLTIPYTHTFMRQGAARLLGHLRAAQACHTQFVAGRISLPELAFNILRITRYVEWLRGEDGDQDDRVDNLNEFIHTLGKFSTIDALFRYIELIQSKIEDKNKQDDRLILCTVHKAKGTENKYVYVVGMNAGVLPHAKASVFEERRVCFVAVSRAEEECWLSTTQRFRGKDCEASSFLYELGVEVPDEIVKFKSAVSAAVSAASS